LNERLWAWIDVYHRAEHSSLGTTPLLRWQRDIEHIRQLPPATDFRRLFFHRLDRLVRRDCTFLLHNRFYEAPPHLAGEPSKRASIPSTPRWWRFIFRANPKASRASSTRWSMPSCPRPSSPKPPIPNLPASTSSICS